MAFTIKDKTIAGYVEENTKPWQNETPRQQRCNLIILVDQRIKRQGERDLYYLLKYILGYTLLQPNPHGELCEFINKYEDEDTMVLTPRGTYKSTVCTVGYCIRRLIRDPNYRLMITSADQDNTKGWLAEIRMHFENNTRFRELYGDFVPKKSKDRERLWHNTAIRIAPCSRHTGTSSITAISYRVSKVSQHYDEVLADDLMNEKTVRTREAIQQCEKHLEDTIPFLDPQERLDWARGPRKVIGTRWGLDDLYGRAIAKDKRLKKQGIKKTWKTFIRRYKEKATGRLYFPAVFTDEYLQRIVQQEQMTKFQVSCQYMNDPQPEEDQVFQLKYIGFWNSSGRTMTREELSLHSKTARVAPVPSVYEMDRWGAVDPASTDKDESDWTGITTIGVHDQNIYILNARRGQWTRNSDIISTMLSVHLTHLIQWWGVESLGFQEFVRDGAMRVFQRHGIKVPIHPFQPQRRDKESRIRSLEFPCTHERIFFRLPDDIPFWEYTKPDPRTGWNYDKAVLMNYVEETELEHQAILLDEMLRFPTGGTRDLLDALAYLKLRLSEKPRESGPKPKKENTFEQLRKQAMQHI